MIMLQHVLLYACLELLQISQSGISSGSTVRDKRLVFASIQLLSLLCGIFNITWHFG